MIDMTEHKLSYIDTGRDQYLVDFGIIAQKVEGHPIGVLYPENLNKAELYSRPGTFERIFNDNGIRHLVVDLQLVSKTPSYRRALYALVIDAALKQWEETPERFYVNVSEDPSLDTRFLEGRKAQTIDEAIDRLISV